MARPNGQSAAANMGVDMRTYNTLLALQLRDITPDDYDTLTRLDSSLKPRTLSLPALEKHAPSWHISESMVGADVDARAPCEPPLTPPTAPVRFQAEACAICLEHFEQGDSVRRLPCKHIFHTCCIDEWLTRCSHICPEDGLPVMLKEETWIH